MDRKLGLSSVGAGVQILFHVVLVSMPGWLTVCLSVGPSNGVENRRLQCPELLSVV